MALTYMKPKPLQLSFTMSLEQQKERQRQLMHFCQNDESTTHQQGSAVLVVILLYEGKRRVGSREIDSISIGRNDRDPLHDVSDIKKSSFFLSL